jgi:hypothetical protein
MFLWFFWQQAWPPIRNRLIKMNSESAKATILEIKKIGMGFASSTTFGGTLRDQMNATKDYQPVWVKLEVHPNNGASYIASDRFNAPSGFTRDITPGAEMQVAVSGLNRHWVAALPETAHRLGQDNQSMAKGPSVSFQGSGINMQGPGIFISGTDLTNDPKAELAKLKEMLDSGLITQQDYEKKKNEILAKMG